MFHLPQKDPKSQIPSNESRWLKKTKVLSKKSCTNQVVYMFWETSALEQLGLEERSLLFCLCGAVGLLRSGGKRYVLTVQRDVGIPNTTGNKQKLPRSSIHCYILLVCGLQKSHRFIIQH